MNEDNFYVTDGEINVTGSDVVINVGLSSIIIDKLFGPTVAASLRITCVLNKGWVIEREDITTGEFIEYIIIPIQTTLDYRDKDFKELKNP